MTTRTPSCVGCLLATTLVFAIPYSLRGQPLAPPPRFHATLSWDEVSSATHAPVQAPNGQLDPGEAALFRFSLAFTPGVGELTVYQMTSGGLAVAPVAGLSSLMFSTMATLAGGGAWSLQPSIPGFEAVIGLVEPETSSILWAGAYQPHPLPGSFPLATNPLPSIWAAVWSPSDYTTRTATFDFRGWSSSGGLFVHTGTNANGHPTFGFAEVASTAFGTLQIPIAPAPASCLPLFALGFAATHRARRRT